MPWTFVGLSQPDCSRAGSELERHWMPGRAGIAMLERRLPEVLPQHLGNRHFYEMTSLADLMRRVSTDIKSGLNYKRRRRVIDSWLHCAGKASFTNDHCDLHNFNDDFMIDKVLTLRTRVYRKGIGVGASR